MNDEQTAEAIVTIDMLNPPFSLSFDDFAGFEAAIQFIAAPLHLDPLDDVQPDLCVEAKP